MADVYCAEDLQLGRKVALKVLHRRFAEDDEFVERFRREASRAAGLQHQNVVSVYDRGEWDGTYYIAMEYLEGRSLKQRHPGGGAAGRRRARSTSRVQILRAARFAHRRGIIHRDLKPHNVIVDDEGRAKVTDFGIARAGASDMTQTGSIMGTAQYLSPEQAQGHAVSAPSDLYSVGIILYEMLTGRVPFEGESAGDDRAQAGQRAAGRRRAASTRRSRPRSRRSSCARWRRTRRAASPTPTRSSPRSSDARADLGAGARRDRPPCRRRPSACRGGDRRRPIAARRADGGRAALVVVRCSAAARRRGDRAGALLLDRRRHRQVARARASSAPTQAAAERGADARGLRGRRRAARRRRRAARHGHRPGPGRRHEGRRRARPCRLTVSDGPGSATVPDRRAACRAARRAQAAARRRLQGRRATRAVRRHDRARTA